MKHSETNNTFENISNSARITRSVTSIIIVVTAMSSPLTGSTIFALLNLFAILLATTAIVGWDPVVALLHRLQTDKTSSEVHHTGNYPRGHHA